MGVSSILAAGTMSCSIEASDAYAFTPKYRFSCKNNALSGITLPQWIRMLYRYRGDIHFATYGFRIFFLTCMASFNTFWSFCDYVLFHRKIVAQKLNPRPIFILGHPRTGTTLIHNVLSHDANLSYASTFQVGFPSSADRVLCENDSEYSFCSLSWAKNLLACIIDKKRPMDDMDLHMDLPGEDELATNMLTSGTSPYMPIFLMTKYQSFWDTYSFRSPRGSQEAPGEDATERKFQEWSAAFTYFLKKVTYWNGGDAKRLIIKSPVHTSRVALLLKMFPQAQFVFVHRDPDTVFQSAAHLADAYYWYTYMSHPTDQEITDFIIQQMELLHKDYLQDRALIPEGNLVRSQCTTPEEDGSVPHAFKFNLKFTVRVPDGELEPGPQVEVSFAELNADISAAFQRIYAALKLPSWDLPNGGVRALEYTSGLTGFKMNTHKPLSEHHRRLLRRRVAFVYDAFGYPMD